MSASGPSRSAMLASTSAVQAMIGASAFTLAFQIPNLIRALVADAALSSAFCPLAVRPSV